MTKEPGADAEVPPAGVTLEVPTRSVVANPDAFRFSPGDPQGLAGLQVLTDRVARPLIVYDAAQFLAANPNQRDAVGDADFVIGAGHGRHSAAHSAGLPTVLVHVVPYPSIT